MDTAIIRATLDRMKAEGKVYGATEEIPQRLMDRLVAVKLVPAAAQAKAAEKVYKGYEMHLLHCWATGKVPGPSTPENLAAKARKAESLARMLDEKGLAEQARSQHARAAALSERAVKAKVLVLDKP